MIVEPYGGGPDGWRTVVYLDKARMEITDPGADPESIWYVTNGLLVVELITGQVQLGDSHFEARDPAQVNVAGDTNDSNGPTYATFQSVLDAKPLPVGEAADPVIIDHGIDRQGNVTTSDRWIVYGVWTARHDEVTNHTIADPFWAFMNLTGPVYDGGELAEDRLFQNPYFATGRPITEAYWSTAVVAGSPTDVLIQCFERRCLTYTPTNPPSWQVEAGNVGLHYFEWRYGG